MIQGALLKSCLGSLARYGTHQETMSGRLEQVYLPSNSRLELGPLFEVDFDKWWGGGQNVGTIQVTLWPLIYARPGSLVRLVRYGTGVNHYQTWLKIVIKFVKIPYLLTSKKVGGSLSKLLCMS